MLFHKKKRIDISYGSKYELFEIARKYEEGNPEEFAYVADILTSNGWREEYDLWTQTLTE